MIWGFCVKLFILISAGWYQNVHYTASLLPSAAATPRQTLPPPTINKKRFWHVTSLPFHLQTIPWDKIGGGGRGLIGVGGYRGRGSCAGAFHLSQCGNYLLLFLLCVSKSLMSPGKVALHANVGVVCVCFPPFPPLSFASKSYMNKAPPTSWFHITSSAPL